jgi:hypothetical protein
VAAYDEVKSGGHRHARRRDDKAFSDSRALRPRRGSGHGGSSLAGGNDAETVGPWQRLSKRALDENSGIGRSDTGPDNRQEVVSKIRE